MIFFNKYNCASIFFHKTVTKFAIMGQVFNLFNCESHFPLFKKFLTEWNTVHNFCALYFLRWKSDCQKSENWIIAKVTRYLVICWNWAIGFMELWIQLLNCCMVYRARVHSHNKYREKYFSYKRNLIFTTSAKLLYLQQCNIDRHSYF